MDFKTICQEVKTLSEEVALFIRKELNAVSEDQIVTKDHNSLVTYVDQTAEKMIVKRLQELIPEATFITEEDTVEQAEGDLVWIIDPLDGTNNFLQKIPHFAVSIALRYKDEMVIGVVYDVMREECFSAVKGEGAYVNDRPIGVSQKESIDDCVLATGFPYAKNMNFKPLINTLEHWMLHARGIRRFGAAALDLCFVAAGRIDCYYEFKLNIWDVAAGMLIVKEAGGEVSDYQGGQTHKTGNQVVASNGKVHSYVIDILKTNFQ